jgi:hypothetical protein
LHLCFMSFDHMATLDVRHRPILKVNLVKPPLVRFKMQKLIINVSFTIIIDIERSTCVWPWHFLDMKDFVKHVLCAIQPYVGFLMHFHTICNFQKNVFVCVGMWWCEMIFLWERAWWWNGWACNRWSSRWSTYARFIISKECCAPLEHNKSLFPWLFVFSLHIFFELWWCITHLLPKWPKVFKQIGAYLASNNVQIFQRWIVCNTQLKFTQPLDLEKIVNFLTS